MFNLNLPAVQLLGNLLDKEYVKSELSGWENLMPFHRQIFKTEQKPWSWQKKHLEVPANERLLYLFEQP